MRTTILASAFLVGVLTGGGPTADAQAQSPAGQGFWLSSVDVAMTYTPERSKVTPSDNHHFWLQGGSIDAAFTFFHGLGVAANLTGGRANGIAPGVNLAEVAIMAGPRYTFRTGPKHENRLFVESLFGGVQARDNVFPTSTGVTPRADSFSWQVGGGWDVAVSKSIAIRLFEAGYIRTHLPNNGTNVQDHLRLAFGVTYHIQRH